MGVDFMGVEFMGVEFMGVGPNLSAHQAPPCPEIPGRFYGSGFMGVDFMGVEFMGVDFMGVEFMGVECMGVDFMGVEFMGVGPNLSAHQSPPMPRNSRTILWEWILWEWARICQPTKALPCPESPGRFYGSGFYGSGPEFVSPRRPPHAQKYPDDFMGVDFMGVGPNLSAHEGPPMPRNTRTILWEWILWEWARICQPTKAPPCPEIPGRFYGSGF